jgi:hypothetical protein
MTARLQIEIAPVWDIILQTKKKVRESLLADGIAESLVDFTEIVVSELMENAIKYGAESSELNCIKIGLEVNETDIIVNVTNGFRDEEELSSFKSVVEKIDKAENKESLYVERLMEILNNPDQKGSQFGLFRIVSECGFSISYTIKQKILDVYARRTYREK